MRKNILLTLLLFSTFFSKAQLFDTSKESMDLTFDYYRAAGISVASSLILKKITKRPIYSGLVGFVLGAGQGLILERGFSGKVVSCMGAGCGQFIYIVACNSKRLKEERKLEESKELLK